MIFHFVMAGLVPGIHVLSIAVAWVAGSSPAMTSKLSANRFPIHAGGRPSACPLSIQTGNSR
jgi:hypothetical protein